MQHSAEIRWFYQKDLPKDVVSWFQQPRPENPREDHYLLFSGSESVGVKIRGGKDMNIFEVKVLQCVAETMQLPGGVSGRTECWVKWSSSDPVLSDWLNKLRQENEGWVIVKKERWLRKFSLDQASLVEVAADDRPREGCNVELTRIAADQQPWWSFAFEAFGKPERVQENLRIVANHFFLLQPPLKPFHIADSRSYPAWLAKKANAKTPD